MCWHIRTDEGGSILYAGRLGGQGQHHVHPRQAIFRRPEGGWLGEGDISVGECDHTFNKWVYPIFFFRLSEVQEWHLSITGRESPNDYFSNGLWRPVKTGPYACRCQLYAVGKLHERKKGNTDL